ncbi:hypothetical protein ABK040_014048 [Willaertia magna]
MTITYALSIISDNNNNNTKLIAETSNEKQLRNVIIEKVIPKLNVKYNTDLSSIITTDNKENKKFDKLILTHQQFNIYLKREEISTIISIYFIIVATNNWKQRMCWKMIDEMSHQYHLTRQLDLKSLQKFYSDINNDKITKLQNEIDQIKDKMILNVDLILENQSKMHELIENTNGLKEQGELFLKGGKSLKFAMIKRWLLLIGAAATTATISIGTIVLILIIAL